ncbi:MAG: pirin family protein [Polyangiales bacterium]
MATLSDARRFPGEPGASNVLALPMGSEDALRMVGPFAIAGFHTRKGIAAGELPVDADVRPHPHIGLAAITYMVEGHLTHRDSLGHRRELAPGSVGLTIAGRGIVHSERFERLRVHGGDHALFQLLLALPEPVETMEPSFAYVAPDAIPLERREGITARFLAHEARGALSLPMPTLLVDLELARGARFVPPLAEERAVFVTRGSLRVGDVEAGEGQVVRLDADDEAIEATSDARALLLGGARSGRRYLWWNYLSSSLERIEEAKAAWRSGTLELPIGDTESFTPAPPDDGRPLRTLNG